jgi:hypothetical protein
LKFFSSHWIQWNWNLFWNFHIGHMNSAIIFCTRIQNWIWF